ncbi:MAG: fatty acid desaturase family protein [Rubrobacter sp.]
MSQIQETEQERPRPETGWAHYTLEIFGVISFFVLALLLAMDAYGGMANLGYVWLLPFLAVIAYLAADLLSGFVHFLADNFGSAETPVIGPNFVGAFREHHVDPKGITHHDFIDTNGNNSLVALPLMLLVWFFVPIETTAWGYLFGAFFLMLCLCVFLTNQFHKWAHMDAPPGAVAWLQERGLILSSEHHDVHHASPYDTYYCITVGFWNPLLDRTRFFERTERLLRRVLPGTDPRLRVEREGSLNDQ